MTSNERYLNMTIFWIFQYIFFKRHPMNFLWSCGTIHPWCDGCQIALNQSPKLALYDLSCRLRSLLSLSWKLQIVLLQNTKYLKYEMQNRFMTNRGGCCWLHSLWPSLAFMKHWNRPNRALARPFTRMKWQNKVDGALWRWSKAFLPRYSYLVCFAIWGNWFWKWRWILSV